MFYNSFFHFKMLFNNYYLNSFQSIFNIVDRFYLFVFNYKCKKFPQLTTSVIPVKVNILNWSYSTYKRKFKTLKFYKFNKK